MGTPKEKLSLSISAHLTHLLDIHSLQMQSSKSHIVEKALEEFFLKKLASDAKKIASTIFDDVPSEEDWLVLQSKID